MKDHPKSVPRTTKRLPVRLLLAGDGGELKNEMVHLTFDGSRRVMIARSPSLLGALERIQKEQADIVLLSQNFQDEEVAVFLSNVRRAGFDGLILRIASQTASEFPVSRAFGFSSGAGFRGDSLHLKRKVLDLPPWDATSPSFTARQRAVLMRVSEGWTNGEVARHLRCTEAAIKATLQQIFNKLGVRKRSQVVRVALEQRLIDDAGDSAGGSRRRTNRVSSLVLPSNLKGKQGYQVGDFVIDVAMHRVWVRSVETHLTPSEFELLAVFAAHQGELVRNSSLCEMFWRNPTAKQDSLRVLVRGLRAKIEISKVPQYIVTERNFGYRFHASRPN